MNRFFRFVSAAGVFLSTAMAASPGATTDLIRIDQFGYLVNGQKIAVISDPQTGYNAAQSFTPGTTYQVRDWFTDAVVFSGSPVAWNSGATQSQSGDKVWWFDFSSFTTGGSYYIFDVANNAGSCRFEIDDCAYHDALMQAMRMFYYQRCGTAKLTANATAAWTDAVCHAGSQQDTDCRLYNNTNVSTSKDLSGGWHDAGDYNKYVNFTWSTLCDLLLAYEANPAIWTDDYNIPESGNGIPDILDEVKYELDWLLKMQNSNGSVLCVIGGGGATPPSADNAVRRYGPATTSATFSCAGIFALAAKQFNTAGQAAYSATLQTAAVNAWTWASANPGITFYNSGTLAAGEQELATYETSGRQLAAAVYLYALTSNATYKTYVDNNYSSMHLLQWTFAYPFEGTEQDALLYYAFTPGATTSVKNAITSAYSNSLSGSSDNLPAFTNQSDAYRAHLKDQDYTWNSNQTKSKQGNMFLSMNRYGLNAMNATNYTNAAAGFLHYFHGVNPNGKTYLSNMSAYGAENSVSSFYNGWFDNGSALWDEVGISTYGPAPGYIPGGPNPSYALDGCCPGGCGSSANNALCNTNVTPPLNQPIQKSYKDFNDGWPVDSWTVTEAGIYTNAAYVRMVSAFIQGACNVSVGIKEKIAEKELLVYPNPSSAEMSISFAALSGRNFKMELYSLTGQLIGSRSIALQENSRIFTFSTSTLENGTYILKISSPESTYVKRITKM